MAKKIKCKLYRDYDGEDCILKFRNTTTPWLCWINIRKICPELCKGLRKDEERELVLTQTKKGIKLERAGDKR